MLWSFQFVLFASYAAERPGGPASLIPPDARLETLWSEGEFTEGVAPAPDGRIYFSDIPSGAGKPGRILRFDPETKTTTVFCADSGKSNGLMFDREGSLIACCGANEGRRALCAFDQDGRMTVLADRFEGKRFNSPNDLVIHWNGDVYFSDPRYVGPEPMEMEQMSVYRYRPGDGTLIRLTTNDRLEKPNGLHLSPDGQILYVAETNNGRTGLEPASQKTPPGRMTLNAFRVRGNGALGWKRVLVDYGDKAGIDGMAMDVRGNIYAAVRQAERPGIVVYDPQGMELGIIPTKDLPTNCAFGGDDEPSTLYITAGGGLYRIQLNVSGFHPALGRVQ